MRPKRQPRALQITCFEPGTPVECVVQVLVISYFDVVALAFNSNMLGLFVPDPVEETELRTICWLIGDSRNDILIPVQAASYPKQAHITIWHKTGKVRLGGHDRHISSVEVARPSVQNSCDRLPSGSRSLLPSLRCWVGRNKRCTFPFRTDA